MSAVKAKQDWDDASGKGSPGTFRNKKGSLTAKALRGSVSHHLLTFKGNFSVNYLRNTLKKEASVTSLCQFTWIFPFTSLS